MSFLEYFSANYREARSKFLAATEQAAAEVEAIENPASAPDGKSVFTDVAQLGEHAAKNVLLVNSATHGVEGFCGSAACVGWLRSDASRALPEGVRAILVHAMNPHGFAWLRRVTEDNVDLNRNFVDHDRTPPPNDEYDRLHPVVLPENWDSASQAKCKETFDRYVDRHGMFALQTVLSRGQYAHPDGLFFGGNAPTWSNGQFRSILDRFVVGAKRLVFLDFHTWLAAGVRSCSVHRFGVGSVHGETPANRVYRRALSRYLTGRGARIEWRQVFPCDICTIQNVVRDEPTDPNE